MKQEQQWSHSHSQLGSVGFSQPSAMFAAQTALELSRNCHYSGLFVCLFVLIIPLRKGGEHSLRNQEGQDGFSFPRNLLPAGISAASAAGLDGFRARSADLPGSLWISGHPSWARGNLSLLLVVVRVKRRFPGSCTSVQRLRMCPGEPEAPFLHGWSLWIGKGLFSPCLFNSCRSGLLLMFRLSSLWRLSEMFN